MMSGLFGGGTPQVRPTPAPASRDDAEVRRAAILARRRQANARGIQDTILTSPLGDAGASRGAGQKKSILGG